MRDELLPAGTTWVRRDAGAPLGYVTVVVPPSNAPADEPAWIGHLYVARDRTGQGLGSQLLAFALAQRQGRAVRLYTFQANTGARRFYERNGFRAIAFSDGRDNMERCPDVLYALPPAR
jgi:GNAT superfamily N-acetyltransferase